MILISKFLVPQGYMGITIFPFIILKHKRLRYDLSFMNHERIHLRQQLELFVLPFYAIYFLEFLVGLIRYKHWELAYRSIAFEREAYKNEKNLDYLKSRPFFGFLKSN